MRPGTPLRAVAVGWAVIGALGLCAVGLVNLGWPMAAWPVAILGAIVAAVVILPARGHGPQPWAALAGFATLLALPATIVLTHLSPLRLLGSALVPVEGMLPRTDLGAPFAVQWTQRTGGTAPRRELREMQLVVAPVLPEAASGPGTPAPVWAVRRIDGAPDGLSWGRPAAEALEALPTLAAPARRAAREAARRAGLVLTAEPVIVTWHDDAAGRLAAQRLRLGGVALAVLLAWALLVTAQTARHRRAPPPG